WGCVSRVPAEHAAPEAGVLCITTRSTTSILLLPVRKFAHTPLADASSLLALSLVECQRPVPEELEVPTYAYACTECDHRFDAVQAFSDASLTDCPECRGRLRKLFSAVGIVFKGSGFYRTDSRTQSNGSNDTKPQPSKSGTDGPSTSKGSKELAAAS